MSSDAMRVRLHLRGVRVLEVVVDAPSRLEVAVEAAWSRSRCPFCGFWCRRVHDRRVKRVWDLAMSGRETVLWWWRRRWRCENCAGRHLEGHPEFEGTVTRRLARHLVGDVAVMPISAAARRARVRWHLVGDLVRARAALVGEHRRRRRCRVLLVDETSIRRRHRYVTVIVSGDTGELLAMVPHRSAEALNRFFAAQGHRWCAGVKVVATDDSKAYKTAIDRGGSGESNARRRLRHHIEPGHRTRPARLQADAPTPPTRSPIDATTSGHISRPDLSYVLNRHRPSGVRPATFSIESSEPSMCNA